MRHPAKILHLDRCWLRITDSGAKTRAALHLRICQDFPAPPASVTMTTDQARELARELIAYANRLDASHHPGESP